MAHRIDVDDPADSRLGDYTRLRDASLRRHVEVERGIFIAEGHKIIARALAAGLRPRSLLLAERWLAGLAPVLGEFDVPVYVVTEALAEEITGFHVHRGALGAFQRPVPLSPDALLGAQRLVVLEDIVDHTNVGACFRSAAGLGWDGVLVSPRCADPLYRRSVKVSMGAVLELPWARLADHGSAVSRLRAAGFTVAALALADEALTLDDFARRVRERPRPVALLLGTEGHGLSDRWLAQADHVVTIPMQRGIDSLNVAAASAVACYELRP
ncbi:TrmH family RNA methyltransferase [Propionicicella superfundia]|uniref:TrmH family RNA methyltransferase n=1 Tax=Propionicicella superfundia TaxID=348582 RepID=UPI0004069762|nr:RNA methyltransferase [Propionicicella superfundia]